MYFEKAELCHPLVFKKPEGVPGIDWHVFDDHVEIDENVILLNADSFTLKLRPVGTVNFLMVRDQDLQGKESVKHDCPEYKKCLSEFGDKLAWSCANCDFDPDQKKHDCLLEQAGSLYAAMKDLGLDPEENTRDALAAVRLVFLSVFKNRSLGLVHLDT